MSTDIRNGVFVRKGVIRGGQAVFEGPLNLPDGTVVLLTSGDESPSDPEAGWDNTPEGIAAWLNWYDSLEPLVFTDHERAEWDAERLARKEWEKAKNMADLRHNSNDLVAKCTRLI